MLLVKDTLKMAETQLTSAGVKEAKVDAELLYRYLFKLDKMGFFSSWSKEISDSDQENYFSLIEKRALGIPLQYITGEQDFMGYTFKVNESVLIPRQDTEILVEKASEIIIGRKMKSVLDLCAGSGCIGISLSLLCKGISVTCSDISNDALKLAKENAKLLKSSAKFVESDLFESFNKLIAKKFDLIVSNPPYIPTRVIDTLDREVKDHEPKLALDGGFDGLDIYRRILDEASRHLNKGGVLAMEIGDDQAEELRLYSKDKFKSFEVIRDLAGLDRVVLLEI